VINHRINGSLINCAILLPECNYRRHPYLWEEFYRHSSLKTTHD